MGFSVLCLLFSKSHDTNDRVIMLDTMAGVLLGSKFSSTYILPSIDYKVSNNSEDNIDNEDVADNEDGVTKEDTVNNHYHSDINWFYTQMANPVTMAKMMLMKTRQCIMIVETAIPARRRL